jgi:hypothetical protein
MTVQPEPRPLSKPEMVLMVTGNDTVTEFRDLTRLLDLAALAAIDGGTTEMNQTLAELSAAVHAACPAGPVAAAFDRLAAELRMLA